MKEIMFNAKCKTKEQRKKIRALIMNEKKEKETVVEVLIRILEGLGKSEI